MPVASAAQPRRTKADAEEIVVRVLFAALVNKSDAAWSSAAGQPLSQRRRFRQPRSLVVKNAAAVAALRTHMPATTH
jgi:hypothetical protein